MHVHVWCTCKATLVCFFTRMRGNFDQMTTLPKQEACVLASVQELPLFPIFPMTFSNFPDHPLLKHFSIFSNFSLFHQSNLPILPICFWNVELCNFRFSQFIEIENRENRKKKPTPEVLVLATIPGLPCWSFISVMCNSYSRMGIRIGIGILTIFRGYQNWIKQHGSRIKTESALTFARMTHHCFTSRIKECQK